MLLEYAQLARLVQESFEKEAVGVSAGLGAEDGDDEGEKEGEEGEADDGHQPPLAHLGVPGLGRVDQQDHAEDDGAVEEHDEVGLRHELALWDGGS